MSSLSLAPAGSGLLTSDFVQRWIVTGILAAVMALGLSHYGVTLDLDSTRQSGRAIVIFLAVAAVYQGLAHVMPLARRGADIATDLVLSLIQIVAILKIVAPLSYLAARAGAALPLADPTLAWLDAHMFGFDWDAAARRVAARPALQDVLSRAYFSLQPQAMVLLLCGSLLHPRRRNAEFIWIVLVSCVVTVVVSAIVPALGKTGQLGPGYGAVVELIRGGGWTVFSYDKIEGIVTFPSFHTTLGLFFIYIAGRLHWALLIVFVPLDIVMLLAVPSIGGHYLVDMCGGAAVAALSIVVVRAWLRDDTFASGATRNRVAGSAVASR